MWTTRPGREGLKARSGRRRELSHHPISLSLSKAVLGWVPFPPNQVAAEGLRQAQPEREEERSLPKDHPTARSSTTNSTGVSVGTGNGRRSPVAR